MFPIELIDLVHSFLEPFERYRLGLCTKGTPDQKIYLTLQTERHWLHQQITFRWSKGYATIRYRPYTYAKLMAYLERAVHRTMHTTPHPYGLRHPKRASAVQCHTTRLFTSSGGQTLPQICRPRCDQPFTHAVYVKKEALGPPVVITCAGDTATVLGNLLSK